jgi:hypothetical protein
LPYPLAAARGGHQLVAAGLVPAVLTLPVDLPLTDTTAYVGVTSDTGSGTLYYVVSTSATPPSVAQIQAGQDSTGSAAAASGNSSASAGVNAFTATGLSSNTAYYAYFDQNTGVGFNSNVSAGNGFTTLTTGTSATSMSNLIAAMSVTPTALRQGYIAQMIQALYASGTWAKTDAMWVMAAHDEQASRLNWITPGSFTLTAVNSPTFTTDRGFAGNGSTSYLDTGWDRATNGVQITQNNAHASVYGLAGTGSNVGLFGTGASSFQVQVAANGGSGASFVRLNTGGSPVNVASGTKPHQIMGRRNNSTDIDVLRNGVTSTAASAQTSSALSTTDLVFLRTGTQYNTQLCAGGAIGAYLDDTEALAYYNAWYAFMLALGADT